VLSTFSAMALVPSIMRWITATELRDIIKGAGKPLLDYAIVDVRDADYDGGNIPNCIHIPSLNFHGQVNELVEQLKSTSTVVFHCYLSQQRGPKAARVFSEVREDILTPEQINQQEILVLRGGFCEFQERFKNDPELVENYRASAWDPNITAFDEES